MPTRAAALSPPRPSITPRLTAPAAALALCGVGLAAGSAAAQAPAPAAAPPSFTVGGAVAAPATYTADALRRRFAAQAQTLAYTLQGVRHTSRVVPLAAVVAAAQPKIDPHVKHGALQAVVTVTGEDGYTVLFSWGELLPDFGHEAVWVALDQDGHAFAPDAGAPVELVVPGDAKAARWVHAVASVTFTPTAGVGA